MKEEGGNENLALYFAIACVIVLYATKKFYAVKPHLIFWVLTHPRTILAVEGFFEIGVSALMIAFLQIAIDMYFRNRKLRSITVRKDGSVYAGRTDSGEQIFIPLEARRMHTQVVGTTNAGKSESVIIPWAVGDLRDNRGFVIVDGKADKTFIDKIYSYAKKLKRGQDFKVLSLQDPESSHTFNPLLGGTPEEVAERVFNSFEFDSSYYKSVQYEVFSQILRIFHKAKYTPTFLRVYQAIRNPEALIDLAVKSEDSALQSWASGYKSLAPSDREERTSGLLSSLSHFAFGTHARLFNTDEPDIDLERAMQQSEVIYFQLPVLKAAFLGKATGKLVLQCLQSAVANRHKTGDKEHKFFSVYLDDFTEYLYPGFVSLLNKSRSANVGVVFAHQSLGDIKALGDDVATSILTNSNLKVIMRGNDPESAEYFAKVIGTKESVKMTERADAGLWGHKKTGQGSIREVEEFVVHPNVIKRNMGVGEALVIIPHPMGTKTVKLKFEMVAGLPKVEMPKPAEKPVLALNVNTKAKTGEEKSQTAQLVEQHLKETKEAA